MMEAFKIILTILVVFVIYIFISNKNSKNNENTENSEIISDLAKSSEKQFKDIISNPYLLVIIGIISVPLCPLALTFPIIAQLQVSGFGLYIVPVLSWILSPILLIPIIILLVLVYKQKYAHAKILFTILFCLIAVIEYLSYNAIKGN